ncbi:MAG TPA: DUF3606 domain-containing protein [Bradyrhizobium sp.]|jgi:hypothetical protein
MDRPKHRHFRNRLDMADHVQVRVIRRRLRLSEPELNKLVDRVGNSIAAISKEVASRKAAQLSPPSDLPPAVVVPAVIDSDPKQLSEPLSPVA